MGLVAYPFFLRVARQLSYKSPGEGGKDFTLVSACNTSVWGPSLKEDAGFFTAAGVIPIACTCHRVRSCSNYLACKRPDASRLWKWLFTADLLLFYFIALMNVLKMLMSYKRGSKTRNPYGNPALGLQQLLGTPATVQSNCSWHPGLSASSGKPSAMHYWLLEVVHQSGLPLWAMCHLFLLALQDPLTLCSILQQRAGVQVPGGVRCSCVCHDLQRHADSCRQVWGNGGRLHTVLPVLIW